MQGETTLDSVELNIVRSLWGFVVVDWVTQDAEHTVGGILLLLDKQMVGSIEVSVDRFSMSSLLKNVENSFCGCAVCVQLKRRQRTDSSMAGN